MTVLDQEVLKWYSADAPPDDQETVLTYVPECGEPVWLGWYDDGTWFQADGGEIAFPVVAWAPMPAGAICAEELCAHGLEASECRICTRAVERATSAKTGNDNG
jgi:hypothetical protein